MFKRRLYYFQIFLFVISSSLAQDEKLIRLSNNVFSLKTFEKQQDRYLAIIDSFYNQNSFKVQFAYINIFIDECRQRNSKKLEATAEISKGNFYLGTGNYFNGIESFSRTVEIFKKLNDYGGLSTAHANLGNAYFYAGDIDKALFYYNLAVSDYKKIKKLKPDSEIKLANSYNSLGTIYCSKGDFVYGKTYFDLAYGIWAKHGDSLSLAYIFNNYANIFFETKKMDSALYYFNKALALKLIHGNNYDKADAYNNLADYYMKNKNPAMGIEKAKISFKYLDTTNYSRQLITCYGSLTEGYHALKDYKNELKYYKLLKLSSDSLNNRVQQTQITRLELTHEFDLIHLSDSIKAAEEIKVKDLKIVEKKQQSYLLIFILILTVVALSLIYSRFKIAKKQKKIIEQKNTEITDSIKYAKKIQQSILPNQRYIDKEIKRLNEKKNQG